MTHIVLFIFVYITHTSPNKSVATIETVTLEQVNALIYKPVTCTTAALLSVTRGKKSTPSKESELKSNVSKEKKSQILMTCFLFYLIYFLNSPVINSDCNESKSCVCL